MSYVGTRLDNVQLGLTILLQKIPGLLLASCVCFQDHITLIDHVSVCEHILVVFAPSRSSCGFLARFTDCGRNRMHHCMFGTSPSRDGFVALFWVVKSCWSTASTSSSSEVYSNSYPGACGARTRAIECEVSVIWFHRAMEWLPFLWYHVCAPESSGAVRSPWSFNGKLVLGPVTWPKPGGCWLQPPLKCRVLPLQRSDSVTIPSPFIQASCTSLSE